MCDVWPACDLNCRSVFLASGPDSLSAGRVQQREAVAQVLLAVLRAEKVRSSGDSSSVSCCLYAVSIISFCV